MTDDTPANDSEATADRFQWVFELEDIQKMFGQRVSARVVLTEGRGMVIFDPVPGGGAP